MVIQTSRVAMAAETTKATYKAEAVSYSGWGNSIKSAELSNTLPSATDGRQTEEKTTSVNVGDLYETLTTSNPGKIFENSDRQESGLELTDREKLELDSLENLLQSFSSRVKRTRLTLKELFDKYFLQMKEKASALYGVNLAGFDSFSSSGGGAVGTRSVNMTVTSIETSVETTNFTSSGKVITADGREMDFDLSFETTRRFSSQTSIEIDYTEVYMMDPLVVNLSGDIAETCDQHFLFDLDCDGEEDNLSLLSKMCGFLALDRNEDGIINDGSELFGAKTGDGFKELAVFDLDGNGWIDENDEIFNHLKIWKKNEDGSNELVGLGVAGIGAIYLGNVLTDLTLRDEEGAITGAIRKTGLYLNENGTSGTIQHVDLAKIA